MPSFIFLFTDRFLAHFVDLHFFHNCSYVFQTSLKGIHSVVSKSLQQPHNGHPCTELCCHLEPHDIKWDSAETWLGCADTRLCVATSVLCGWDVLNGCYLMGTHVTWHWHSPLALTGLLLSLVARRWHLTSTRVSPKLTHQNPLSKFKTVVEDLLRLIPHKFTLQNGRGA